MLSGLIMIMNNYSSIISSTILHLRSAALEGAEVWLCEAVPLMRHVCREVVAANSGLVAEKRGTGGLLGVGGGLSMDMYCIVLYIYIYYILHTHTYIYICNIYIYICIKQGKIMNNHDGGNTFQGYFVVRKIFDSENSWFCMLSVDVFGLFDR
jgi:hypothetical protein